MKTIFKNSLIPILLIVFSSTGLHAQFVLEENLTVNELVNDYFNSGQFVEISNITFNGIPGENVDNQIALFSGGEDEGFPFEAGLSMSTTSANRMFLQGFQPLTNQWNNDPDIIAISGASYTYDCAVIEFDVVVNADALVFNYVFGSQEYEVYNCSQFNDAFGLFISGPGIDGPYENNAENIALIPNSDTPVAINTVNSGNSNWDTGGLCETANPNWLEDAVYYVNNISTGEYESAVGVNGYTVSLQAFKEVIVGETYHLKFAICDVLDGGFDSAVFLGEESFAGIMINKTEDVQLKTLSLFPNPATDILTIDLDEADGQTRFDILDIQGRLIRSVSANGQEQITIPVQELDLGFYVISQYTEDALVARAKFVKE